MLISVTAPRKGLGQTVTAINLGAMINKVLNDSEIMFVDINKYCEDIDYYLSDASLTKGLDDFINLHNSGLLNSESFKTCVKKMRFNINLMSAHKFFEISDENIRELINYANELYDFVIVDSISGDNKTSNAFFEKSKVIVVVLNPLKNVVSLVEEMEIYKKHKEKIIFVVNRHIENHAGESLEYKVAEVKDELRARGFNSPVFPLEFDVQLINECNYGSILNFVLGTNIRNVKYIYQLEKLVEYIFRQHTTFEVSEKIKRATRDDKFIRWIKIIKKHHIKLIKRYFR